MSVLVRTEDERLPEPSVLTTPPATLRFVTWRLAQVAFVPEVGSGEGLGDASVWLG